MKQDILDLIYTRKSSLVCEPFFHKLQIKEKSLNHQVYLPIPELWLNWEMRQHVSTIPLVNSFTKVPVCLVDLKTEHNFKDYDIEKIISPGLQYNVVYVFINNEGSGRHNRRIISSFNRRQNDNLKYPPLDDVFLNNPIIHGPGGIQVNSNMDPVSPVYNPTSPTTGSAWNPTSPTWNPTSPTTGSAWNPTSPTTGSAWNPTSPTWNPTSPTTGSAWNPTSPTTGSAWNPTSPTTTGSAWNPTSPTGFN